MFLRRRESLCAEVSLSSLGRTGFSLRRGFPSLLRVSLRTVGRCLSWSSGGVYGPQGGVYARFIPQGGVCPYVCTSGWGMPVCVYLRVGIPRVCSWWVSLGCTWWVYQPVYHGGYTSLCTVLERHPGGHSPLARLERHPGGYSPPYTMLGMYHPCICPPCTSLGTPPGLPCWVTPLPR